MSKIWSALLTAAVAATGARADGDILWDNGIEHDNVTATVVPTPRLPDPIIVDEVIVPEGAVWIVTGFRYVLVEDDGWEDGGVTEVCVWSDSGGGAGPLAEIYAVPHRHTRRFAGFAHGRRMHEYTAEGLRLVLLPGTYWFGPELAAAHGDGHAYWVTARLDAVRRQGDLSWFSPNGGAAWCRHDAMGWEGDYWHQAFQVLGCDLLEEGAAIAPGPGSGPGAGPGAGPGPGPGAPGAPAADGRRDHAPGDTERRAGAGDLLWDNNIIASGTMARALSPPAFPNIRVVDDFVVPEDGWTIHGFHLNVIEDAGWTDGGRLDFYIREDKDGPGALLLEGGGPFMKMATGRQLFSRDEYHYWLDVDVVLEEGKYWVGFRNPNGGGAGTNYWNISSGGEHAGTWGWFSLDAGMTWAPEGATWDHGFEIRGEVGTGFPAAPQRFEVTRGRHVAGGLLALQQSDDRHLVVAAVRPSQVSQPSVQVVVEARADGDVGRLRFELEASTTIARPVQWIDFYDFEADLWERMDTREASTDDTVTRVAVKEGAGRFVEPDSGRLLARVSFYDPGVSIAGWSGRIDFIEWRLR